MEGDYDSRLYIQIHKLEWRQIVVIAFPVVDEKSQTSLPERILMGLFRCAIENLIVAQLDIVERNMYHQTKY
jgi:hypothetical protein